MRRLGRAVLIVAAAGAVAPTGAPAAVQLRGGEEVRAVVCGAERPVTVAAPGAEVRARATRAKTPRGRAARRGARLAVSRCEDGRWASASRLPVHGGALDTSRAATGDYRVRVVRRGGQGGRSAFLRVGAGEIVDVPVTFSVVNRNRSRVPCLPEPDGRTYAVRGSLVAPRAALQRERPAATLYAHGLSYASHFFRLQSVPGYDYGLEQARDGHASVIIDRLGYPGSAVADGSTVCYGSQADVLHQVIGALRDGAYRVGEDRGPHFARVALAGHSGGGFIAEMTQYSFASADALAVLGYSDSGASPLVLATLTEASARCVAAPERAGGDQGAPNFAYFGQTEADFRAGHVVDADERVVAEALAKRTRDPCGDLLSIPPSYAFNQPFIRTIAAPLLLVLGAQDAFFPPPAGVLQDAFAYLSSDDATYVELPGTGHGLTLGRTHDRFRAAMHEWLRARGF